MPLSMYFKDWWAHLVSRLRGAFDRGSCCRISILRCHIFLSHIISHVTCPIQEKKDMSLYVLALYMFWPYVAVAKVYVALSNLRNGHVTLSVLGVKGH